MDIRKECERIYEDVVTLRRKLHQHPEIGMELKETSDIVCSELDKLGVPYRRLGDSGIIAEIKGEKQESSHIVMLRADMDALNITEETGLPFASLNKGKMHACGHDMHTAMLLGTARILSENKKDFKGTARLLFQAAEEISDGALFLIENGALEGVEAGMGIHMDPFAETGTINAKPGPDWAAVDRFVITVKGKGGHGALPHENCDAIVAACNIVTNLQTLVSRETDPMQSLVVTVGSFHAGTSYNIIAETAVIEGTCRCFDPETYEKIPSMLERISVNTAAALKCSAELTLERLIRPLVNDEKMYERLKRSAVKVLDNENDFQLAKPAMLGEDFAEYADRVPCVFAHLGASGEYPLHSSHLVFDEKAMLTGMACELQFVIDSLEEA
ncbi:MAG: amidohydrolase [Erysipelotrichaceae bacterium]|nr:amidohydrolase [Erysipelotrichaceae bacterium]